MIRRVRAKGKRSHPGTGVPGSTRCDSSSPALGRRAGGHERVAVHIEGAGVGLAFGAAEGVGRLADHHIGETAVLEDLLPARTGQPAGYSTSPQVDVAHRLNGYGAAVGDVGELESPAGAQYPADLGEHGPLVGA